MDSEMKFREFFRVSRDIFHFILKQIKEDITPTCSRWQTPISAEQKLSYTKVSKKVIIFDRVLSALLTQSVITVAQKK
jgi:cell division inhibitor SulA